MPEENGATFATDPQMDRVSELARKLTEEYLASEEPPVMNLREYGESLSRYSAEDYTTMRPFLDLVEYTHGLGILYRQFLGVMKKDAEAKGVDTDKFDEISIGTKLRTTVGANTIFNITIRLLQLNRIPVTGDDEKVSVFPLMCGAGKSTALSYLIQECMAEHLSYDEPGNRAFRRQFKELHGVDYNYGILIVTDRKDRLKEYMIPDHRDDDPDYDAERAGYRKELTDYLQEHRDLVTTITSANKERAMANAHKTPVLMMTTQRYFSLDREEIIDLLKWDNGYRNLVVFDEEPCLKESLKISINDLNDVTNALNAIVCDEEDERQAKKASLEAWREAVRVLSGLFDYYEENLNAADSENNTAYCWHRLPVDVHLLGDDSPFWEFVAAKKSDLRNSKTQNGNAYNIIRGIGQANENGALFVNSKQQPPYYVKALGVVLDHRDMLLGLGTNVVILDGTASLSPSYQEDYFDIRTDYEKIYRRSLSNLHLKFVDVQTSRSRMKLDTEDTLKTALRNYLRRCQVTDYEGSVFTYKEDEAFFKPEAENNEEPLPDNMLSPDDIDEEEDSSTGRLGGVRGSNKYKDKNRLAQIGLLRCAPMIYTTLGVYQRPDLIERFNEMEPLETVPLLDEFMKDTNYCEDVMNRYLLTDMEQNMFRGKIRDPQSTDPYYYYVFCKLETFRNLIDMAKRRFYDAEFEELPTPEEVEMEKVLRRKGSTNAKVFIRWYQSLPSGTEFTVATIIEQTGLTQQQFNKIKENNPWLKDLLKSIMYERGKYRKP